MKKSVFNSTGIRLLGVAFLALNLAGCTAEWEQPGCRCADWRIDTQVVVIDGLAHIIHRPYCAQTACKEGTNDRSKN